jgi:hypothetical protein
MIMSEAELVERNVGLTLCRFLTQISCVRRLMICGIGLVWMLLSPMVLGAADPSVVALNVMEFGAIGDGVIDDTDAIQATVNAFVNRFNQQRTSVSNRPNAAGYSKPLLYCAHDQIVFPQGTYRITRPIVFDSRYAYMRGIGKVVIHQTHPDQMAFYFHATKESRIKNLTITGGLTQMRFWTANKNDSVIFIDDCTFSGSGDYAVVSRSYTQMKLKGNAWHRSKPWPPFLVQWDNGQPTLLPNDPTDISPYNNSTLAVISNCEFENCMRVADLTCDLSVVRDCKVNVSPLADGPQFKFWKQGRMYRIKGLANPSPGKHPYWIENQALLSVRDIDLKTLGTVGMELSRTHLPGYKEGWLGLIVDGAKIHAANSKRNAVAWFGPNIAPNIFSLTGIEEISHLPVEAVAWQQPSDLENLVDFANATNWNGAKLKDQFHFTIDANGSSINSSLPEALEPYREKPIPEHVIEQTLVPRLSWDFDDLIDQTASVIRAVDFGLDADPSTDDTVVVEQIFQHVREKGACQVLFPGRVIKISKTIQLPPNVVIRGQGMVVFEQLAIDEVVFHADDAQQIGFENCLFNHGRVGLDIQTRVGTAARISLKDCIFSGQWIGVQCLAGKGQIGEANQTELLFDKGKIFSVQAVVTNALKSQLVAIWGQNDALLNDQGFIENCGGMMRVQTCLNVPILWAGDPANRQPVADWPNSRKARWIDNWGKLYCQDTRFGGEGGGMCNVMNRSTAGTVYISGGISRFSNAETYRCITFLEQQPQYLVLRNISSFPPVNYNGTNRVMSANGKISPEAIFVRGVLTPQDPNN